ncbi:MAG: EI24 domain-containing protein [Pseudomonadota bacterium]
MIIGDFLKALAQILDRRFRGVLLKGFALSAALLIALAYGLIALAGWLLPDAVTLPWIGTITWVDTALSWASVPLVILLSVVLMVPVASLFTGLFLDEVADAVEARHYPHLPAATPPPLIEAIRDSLGFVGLLIAVNGVVFLAAIPLAPLAPVLFFAANGYLLGREYFQIAAMRRLGRRGAREAFRQARGQVWLAGLLMVVPLTIPVVNLAVPILGAATFTHLFHRLNRLGQA